MLLMFEIFQYHPLTMSKLTANGHTLNALRTLINSLTENAVLENLNQISTQRQL